MDVAITDIVDTPKDDSTNNEEAETLYDWNTPNPIELPKTGEKIEYLDDKSGPPVIRKATVTLMYNTVQLKYPGWVNIINDGAHKQSSIKLNDYRWRSVNDQDDENGNSTLNDDDRNVFDTAFNEAAPANDHLSIPFPEVQNLDRVLPLTSTPASSTTPVAHFPQRTCSVRPRGLLPMEFEDSPLASGSNQPSRYKRALAEKARQIQRAITRRVDDASSDSN